MPERPARVFHAVPDPAVPCEQVPTEVMDEVFRRTSASIDASYADAWQAFESQLATTKVSG